MAKMEQEPRSSAEAGPSSPSRGAQSPAAPQQDPLEPRPPRTDRSPTPQSHPATSPHSRTTSRSPSTSIRAAKRAISPVPEEPPHATIKRPRPPPTEPDKRRGQRLFGVLTSTLSQFKRESESERSASAAQKRAEIEARLATKARQEERVIDAVSKRRGLVWEARALAEEIAQGDAQQKTLRGMKRRMASFLYTPSARRASRTGRGARLAEDIPTAVRTMSRKEDRDGDFALYFLPGKTLPEQEDRLNEQEDDVDDKIDRFDDDWVEARARLMERLEEVKLKIREV